MTPPHALSPPWGGGSERGGNAGGSRWEEYDTSFSGSADSSTGREASRAEVSNNWSAAVPLPRLALLSGLTALRLNVSLAGVQARVRSRGLVGEGGGSGGADSADSVKDRPAGGSYQNARKERARRCIRRVARQLVERIHPAAASPGFRQACRLFRDEMGALGYDAIVLTRVLQALLNTSSRLRDPGGHDECKAAEEAIPRRDFLPFEMGSPVTGAAPGVPRDAPLAEESDETGELVDAGMAALPKTEVSEGSSDGGSNGGKGDGEERLLLDIASIEVR